MSVLLVTILVDLFQENSDTASRLLNFELDNATYVSIPVEISIE